MFLNRITVLFKIRPDELRLVSLIAALFLCLQAGGGMGDNAASALFLLRFGADFLPYLYIGLGILNFILALAYATGLGRFKKERFFLWLLGGFALLILLERIAIFHPFPALYPILWLTISGISLILGTFIWNLAGEVCDARQAKRLFPIFTSAGILGSVVGNSITGIVATAFGTENLFILQAALLGLVLLLTSLITRDYFKPNAKSTKSESLSSDLRVGLDFVRGSSLMKLIAYASILFSILFFGIAFPFSKVVAASFPDEARVAGFLGLFSSITTATTFLVSLFIANRLYTRLGIVSSVLLLPLTYIFGFGFFAFNYNLIGAVTARFTQMVMLSGAAESGWNALFNVVPSQKRGQVLAFQNGLPSQIGVILSGVLLILGEKVLTVQQIFLMCGAFAVVCGIVIWRMRPAYGEALIAALRAGRVEVFSAQESAFAGIKSDPFAVSIAVQSLHDSKPTTRLLAAEILGKMGATSTIPALTGALSDSEAGVRCAVISALGDLRAQAALENILSCLEDGESEVRGSALMALPKIVGEADRVSLEKIEGLLQDPVVNVRMQAALALARFGFIERGMPILMEQLIHGEIECQRMALEMLTEIALATKSNGETLFDIQPLISALDHSSPAIRKAACKTLGCFDNGSTIESLIKCLYDEDATVRQAAAESLRGFGAKAQPRIIEVLQSNDSCAQESALEVIRLDGTEMRSAFLDYIHRESSNIHFLRLSLNSLAGEARSIRLLRGVLQKRIALHEKHLVKVIGIFGDSQAMELVHQNLRGRDHETHAAALETLETLGDKQLIKEIMPLLENETGPESTNHESSSLVNTLETLLSNPDDWMCALTIRIICELGLRDFIPKLRELKSDPESLTAQSAREALIQFGEEKSMDTLQTISTLERVLLLRDVPIFTELSPEDLKQIADIAREQWLPDGAILCRAGEEGNAMYIIVSGKVRVQKDADGDERDLAVRGEGDFVGEMAIIESAARIATLRALGDLRVLVIEGEAFAAILRDRPEVSISVMKTLSRRLREMV